MNWWAKRCSPSVSIFCLLLLITSCKKEGDFNLGGIPAGSIGAQFTDTLTLENQTFLLNDSIISAKPAYMSFGGYSDPGVTGVTYAEAYTALSLYAGNVDYTGITIDSSNLYMYYTYTYGDTLVDQDFSVHQVTTQMDVSVPYQTTTNFVSYDPTVAGSVSGVQARPYTKSYLRIPLTNAFTTNLLNAADDRNTTDFQSNFYGIVIKANNNTTGSVITANFSDVITVTKTRLTVYFKRGGLKDSTVFLLVRDSPSFNRLITDRSGTAISSLAYNGDNISDASTSNKCYLQAGTGVVTKVTMPNLKNFATIDGSSVIINRAILVAPIDVSSNINTYRQVTDLALVELNPDNSYKYRNNSLAYILSSTPTNLGTYPNASASATSLTTVEYRFEITRYLQSVLNGIYQNDGFIITPLYNSYYTNRSVLNSFNAPSRNMRIEIYYTKVN